MTTTFIGGCGGHRRAESNEEYLMSTLTFSAPIYANLFDDKDGDGYPSGRLPF